MLQYFFLLHVTSFYTSDEICYKQYRISKSDTYIEKMSIRNFRYIDQTQHFQKELYYIHTQRKNATSICYIDLMRWIRLFKWIRLLER